ncbi:hypothetical protein ACFFUO_09515 [Vibrio artabrorum]|uniref:Uncharacterized protein n=1 Tax=Vibrio artabrorum TaxID=446374 RepID=A0ABT8CHW7_9VIBR|nr:hypothetical protein [Vibrio artabrorum]MDN3701318.1 hypothetical protein [Vibrio artabrorum]
MDRLSITTHLIAVLTAFSAFTMPIALEVLNRVKSRYGSAHYMDSIEQIMGFKIQLLFRELIVTLVALIAFTLFVSTVDDKTFSDRYVLLSELAFALITSALLIKEFLFIKTVFLATRSDDLVTEHLISKLSTTSSNNTNHSREVELLIQIACFNIENTAITSEKSTEKQLFDLIESSCINNESSIDTSTLKKLVDGLAATLTSARNTNSRDKYVSLQRDYGRLLILFFDKKMLNYDVFERFSQEFYEESIKEINSGQYWLLKADFLISVNAWDIQSPNTITFIDRHIRNLIDFLVDKKPELLPELIENYRSFIAYESHFNDDLYRLSDLFGDYNNNYFEEMSSFTANNEELLKTKPQEYIDNFILLLDKYTQDSLLPSVLPNRREEIKQIASEYEQEMITEIIRELATIAAKNTAQHAIRALAQKSQWGCILDCHERFSPASSKVIRLGVSLLPSSTSCIIQQLGKSHGYSSLHSEELGSAYNRAFPLLVMYALYNWRINNLEKNLRHGVTSISGTFNIGEKTIKNAKKILSELTRSMYYAKSRSYAESLCYHFDIKHEEAEFHNATLLIIRAIKKHLNNQLQEMKRTQPLSETIKQRYIDSIRLRSKDLQSRLPLLSSASFTRERQEPRTYPAMTYSRETFLDNTDVTTSFSSKKIIEHIHSNLAFKKIEDSGLQLINLEISDLEDNHTVIMTNKDWQKWTESKDREKLNSINRYLVRSTAPLNSYYLYDSENVSPMITLFAPNHEADAIPIVEHINNAFEFRFNDNGSQVSVEIDAHIYY